LCTIEVKLSKGTLSAQGLLPQRSDKNPVAIIGGTGAYAGAHGVAVVTDTGPSTTTVDVTLAS
ncbi:MAG: dirigent protein, partial [Actinomycetota bacterium]|nr:dirigent protein [Actinomycetota bacterium]